MGLVNTPCFAFDTLAWKLCGGSEVEEEHSVPVGAARAVAALGTGESGKETVDTSFLDMR